MSRHPSHEGLSEIMDRCMHVTTQAEADECFRGLVAYLKNHYPARGDAEVAGIARDNLGYWAGHNSNVRAIVEPLYGCEHPHLGTVAEHGLPTPEEAFAIGVRIAEARRIGPDEYERVRAEIRAELKAAYDDLDPRCVCGHRLSRHVGGVAVRSKCTAPDCACGPGCIHNGFVDARGVTS